MYDLTPKEFEALALIAQGMSNRQAAKILSVSPRTIGNHVSNILGKTYCQSKYKLVVLYLRNRELFSTRPRLTMRQEIVELFINSKGQLSPHLIACKVGTKSIGYVRNVIRNCSEIAGVL